MKIINTSYTFHMHYLEYNSKANLMEKCMDFKNNIIIFHVYEFHLKERLEVLKIIFLSLNN